MLVLEIIAGVIVVFTWVYGTKYEGEYVISLILTAHFPIIYPLLCRLSAKHKGI